MWLDLFVHGITPGLLGLFGEARGVLSDGLLGFASGDDGAVDAFLVTFVVDLLVDGFLDALEHGVLLLWGGLESTTD